MKKSAIATPPHSLHHDNIVSLKDGRKVKLRLLLRRDVNGVWANFNEVVNERIYLPAYTPVVDEWEKQSWFQDMVTGKNFCAIAVTQKDRFSEHNVVGQCTIEDIEWEAATHVGQLGIIIRSDCRNSGLGHQLIKFAQAEAFRRGKKKLILTTFDTNKMGLTLYAKMGFRTVGKYKKQYYINGSYVDEVIMEYLYDDFGDINDSAY